MIAAAVGALMLASCAAGVLGSQRHGEQSRARQWLPVSLRGWRLWSVAAQCGACFIAIEGFGWAVGLAVWLSTLSLVGAAVTGWVAAVPRAASPIALLASVAGLIAIAGAVRA